jgi:hypothetical protein
MDEEIIKSSTVSLEDPKTLPHINIKEPYCKQAHTIQSLLETNYSVL